MLGYTVEELVGMSPWQGGVNMSETEIRSNFKNLGNINTIFETRHCRKDGSVYDAEVSVTGVTLNGEVSVLAITRDISARVAANRALIDTETLEFIEFNAAACATLGYTREELARMNLLQIYPTVSRRRRASPSQTSFPAARARRPTAPRAASSPT
jgi:PAS domain-containing protein